MHRRLTLFTLVLAVMSVPTVAYGKIDITVLAGAGGYVRQHAVTPVQVILQNDESHRDGYVSVAFLLGGTSAVRATRSVELPPKSRKRLFLYLPMDRRAEQIAVRYQTPRGRKVAEIKERLTHVASNPPVVCAVGRFPSGLPPDEVDKTRVYSRLMLRADQLPDRHDGLDMFDVLLLTPPPYEPLNRAQIDALKGWMLRGGTLVVDASDRTDAFRTGSFDSMLPYSPRGSQEAVLDLLGEETVFTAGEIRGGRVLLQSNGRPLAVRANYGLGSVTCLAVDPAQPSFTDWAECESFWKEVLGRGRTEIPEGEESALITAVGGSFKGGKRYCQSVGRTGHPQAENGHPAGVGPAADRSVRAGGGSGRLLSR